jgi:hypothetical protein
MIKLRLTASSGKKKNARRLHGEWLGLKPPSETGLADIYS